jgi:2-polyprenyl-3-methyl-5-hydroxy-6-metoxy-1,4-benzoquinol methylase
LICLYENYYTHGDGAANAGGTRKLYNKLLRAYQKTYFHRAPSIIDRIIYLLLLLHPGRASAALAGCMGIRPVSGGRLLEVGCGDGTKLVTLNELGWVVEGVDFDHNAVASARKKGLVVSVGGLEQQHYTDATFDAIVSNHLVEHVPDIYAMFSEALRVLKPGGHFVAYTPNAASAGHRIFKQNWRGLEPPRHLQIFTPLSLANLAQSVGYEVEVCGASGRGGAILVKSYKLWRGKSGVNEIEKLNKVDRFFAEALGFAEGLVARFNNSLGEEIVLIARKPVK